MYVELNLHWFSLHMDLLIDYYVVLIPIVKKILPKLLRKACYFFEYPTVFTKRKKLGVSMNDSFH